MGHTAALHAMKLRILEPPHTSISWNYGGRTHVSNLRSAVLWPANREPNLFSKMFQNISSVGKKKSSELL
jgi:hypothetical protein